ncbi:MAG: DinB family protein [Acidobacteriota bacterium]
MTNKEFFLQHCASEFPRFVGVFEAAPGDQLAYRPHPKSRSAEELIGHLIGHEQDLLELTETGKIHHRMQVPFASLNDALDLYRTAHAGLEKALASMDDKSWEANGQFLVNGNVVYELPKRDLAWLLLFDGLHHRGQLSTYLRPMGGKVPSIYGPSADSAAPGS